MPIIAAQGVVNGEALQLKYRTFVSFFLYFLCGVLCLFSILRLCGVLRLCGRFCLRLRLRSLVVLRRSLSCNLGLRRFILGLAHLILGYCG